MSLHDDAEPFGDESVPTSVNLLGMGSIGIGAFGLLFIAWPLISPLPFFGVGLAFGGLGLWSVEHGLRSKRPLALCGVAANGGGLAVLAALALLAYIATIRQQLEIDALRTGPAKRMTESELWEAHQNKTSFKGKVIEVRGLVTSQEVFSEPPVIYLDITDGRKDAETESIPCAFFPSQEEGASLRPGQHVTVRGTCRGHSFQDGLTKCIVK